MAQLEPSVVFLDFDRTVCTTKKGADPLQGTHRIDSDLLTLMCLHPNVHIVTRNRHQQSIESFLKLKGVPQRVQVHSTKLLDTDKVDIIRPRLSQDQIGLFIDDDVHELVKPSIVELPGLHRVLFVRCLN
eukprot:TRINITY_DN6430_c0_g1_i1.p1 TRINITY_DN6430_c0_g1~~TRINITY_DN6430_c0_g1_i1.p1  ORF type:complete len:130 (-),score=13.59 TRINITY_DN6430_c0_g1_i1:71-460(-)